MHEPIPFMQFLVPGLLIFFALIISAFVSNRKKKSPEVTRAYKAIMAEIEGAATSTALSHCRYIIDEFKETYTPYWVIETTRRYAIRCHDKLATAYNRRAHALRKTSVVHSR